MNETFVDRAEPTWMKDAVVSANQNILVHDILTTVRETETYEGVERVV